MMIDDKDRPGLLGHRAEDGERVGEIDDQDVAAAEGRCIQFSLTASGEVQIAEWWQYTVLRGDELRVLPERSVDCPGGTEAVRARGMIHTEDFCGHIGHGGELRIVD